MVVNGFSRKRSGVCCGKVVVELGSDKGQRFITGIDEEDGGWWLWLRSGVWSCLLLMI